MYLPFEPIIVMIPSGTDEEKNRIIKKNNVSHVFWINNNAEYLLPDQLLNLGEHEHVHKGFYLLTPTIDEDYEHVWVRKNKLEQMVTENKSLNVTARQVVDILKDIDYDNDTVLWFDDGDSIMVYYVTLTGMPRTHN